MAWIRRAETAANTNIKSGVSASAIDAFAVLTSEHPLKMHHAMKLDPIGPSTANTNQSRRVAAKNRRRPSRVAHAKGNRTAHATTNRTHASTSGETRYVRVNADPTTNVAANAVTLIAANATPTAVLPKRLMRN